MLARSPLFEKFSLQRNFQGLLSIVQLSRFLSFFLCDSFDILSNLFRFVKNFFIFLFCRSASLSVRFKRQLIYVITSARRCQQFFSSVFSALPAPLLPLPCPRLFRLRVSGWPDSLRLFKSPSSATGAILSLREGIVNVFSVFYLFQTIRTILTVSFLYKWCHQP